MVSLAQLALDAMPCDEWLALDKHFRLCLNPDLYFDAPCVRMASFCELLEDKAGENCSLAPQSTEVHAVSMAHRVLRSGDHVVIMIGGWRHGYAHHGIVVGETQVIDFSSPTGDKLMRDAQIRITPSDKFLLGHSTFGIVSYIGGDRERTVALARAFLAAPRGTLPVYDLIRWNCECFAWVCKTGGQKFTSDQIERILKAIQHDLSKGSESFLIQCGAVSSGSCIIS